ncbi:MAG: FtsX-like permease family protein [Hyphomicrobiaceae bacterium]|nr:FtsX-like permease family protein [Hyphomicrobiaceae bacterium]
MTSADTIETRGSPSAGRVAQVVRLALREVRSGVSGFHVFIACVALGVMVIAGVGALTDSLRLGFEQQGETILGGDVALSRAHRRAEEGERAWLLARGQVSETATMRTMARRVDGQDQALAELKGVDRSYPLAGAVTLANGIGFDQAVHEMQGAAVAPILLERLDLEVGDLISLGSIMVPITGVVEHEPDNITDRLTYGPRVFVSLETMQRTGLLQPGSLVRWRYALELANDAGADAEELIHFRESLASALPESGFTVTDRRNPSPRVTRTLDRLRQFLTLLGLTALLVGGIGVANAVATFVDRRRKVIATFKSLGATSGMIFGVFLTQVLLMAGLGVAIGLVLGYLVPVLLNGIYGDALPIRAQMTISLWSIVSAAAYGFLVALVFTLLPLGRAELVRAGVLFRDEVAPEQVRPRPRVLALTAAAVAALVLFAVLSSEVRWIAIYFCLGLVAVFALFAGLGTLVTRVARRMPRPRTPEIALAVGNLGAPGGLTRSIVLSLGAGLSLLVAVALSDASLVRELTTRLPETSPTYFVLDVGKGDAAAFRALVQQVAPGAVVREAPMLRGRLVRLGGTPAEQVKAAPEAQWVLSGDRGLTYSEAVPEGSRVVTGSWWPADYDGEPLVSFEAELAGQLGLAIGDTVTVNVLGRNVSARIANLREVNWESLAINFVMVFSPNALSAAPHGLLATVTLPEGAGLAEDAALARSISNTFPSATAIRVKDAIDSFNAVLQKVMTAVRVAGGITLLAGALVLAGALSTAQRRRIKQAVILKTLGAVRRRILLSHFAEYAILATVTAAVAAALGTFSAWIVVTQVMEIDFTFSPMAVASALAVSLALVMGFGGLGTWQVLRAPAAPHLRSD